MNKKTDKIIEEFEAELKAGAKPSIKGYQQRYGKLSDETIGTLLMLGALYENKKDMQLPDGFAEQQRKLAQDLIDGKPTDWYFKKKRPEREAVIMSVPHPLTKEKGGIPVVSLAAAGNAQVYEVDTTLTPDGWEKITRPFDLPNQDVFAIQVKGDSLEPLIPDGSYAVINPRREVYSNALAVVITNDYRSCIKKIKFQDDKVILISSNPEYPPRELDKKDIWKMYPVAWVKFK